MINVPNPKKVTNAVPTNKKCWIAAVKHLGISDEGKITRREFARMCFSMSGDERKGFLSDRFLLPKRSKTRFWKSHMTNGHKSPKGRQLLIVPQQYNRMDESERFVCVTVYIDNTQTLKRSYCYILTLISLWFIKFSSKSKSRTICKPFEITV